MGFHKLVNTRYFSEAAIGWWKNGGRYTIAPHGSRDYFQYWDEQDRRCRFGYKVGDLWIPGRAYYYLNFFPMSRVPDNVLMKAIDETRSGKGKISITTASKIIDFPKFWEIDYEWWNFKHIAWYGGEFMGVKSEGGKHLSCLKTRGAGFSYKEAADGCYNYNFIAGSKSYYFAGSEPYLIGDAIMDKVQAGLDWINEYSPYWKQNRQKKFSPLHQRASYVDAGGVERGSFSEIIGQVVDKPSKTRGKRGRKATFEEAGSFPHLEKALRVAMGSMSEGSVYVGQISVFGTGGEKGPGIQGLENIFYSPKAWDMLAFPNIFTEGMQHTEVGYFVPCYRANIWAMDENGNVDLEKAIKEDDKKREEVKTSGKPKDYDDRIAEYPRTPAEALQRMSNNGFNIAAVRKQILRIQTSKEIQALIRHGKLTRCEPEVDPSGVVFEVLPKHKAKPIEDFPHKPADDLTGCVSLIQKPFRGPDGKTPNEVYVITFDAYYKDDAEDVTSLFSIKVWKQENPWSMDYIGLPVAWFAGRPKDLNDCYRILFNLAKYYNAKIQGEVAGGGQGVINWAKTYRLLHYLKHEPMMVHNKELASKSAGNAYLMNLATDRKKLGITYLESWHMEPRAATEKGDLICNVDQIYDIAWLREMEKFDPTQGNYDRISDAIIAMYELKEATATVMQQVKSNSEFFSSGRVLFGGNEYGQEQGTVDLY